MTPNELENFLNHLRALAMAFGREADEPTCMAYEIGLVDLPIADSTRAMKRAMRECRFMPTPAELRELAGVVNLKQRAILAWDALDAAVVAHGYYRSVDFDDRIINATVRNLGGWKAICDKPLEEYQTFFRKEFERVYLALCQTGVSAEQSAALTGQFAAVNGPAGHAVADPVRIETGLPTLPQIGHSRTAQALIGAK